MIINHIDEVLPHVEGRKDFVIKYKQDYTVIDYVYELDDTFDNEYRRECRGLKFTPEGDILARPFHKFFNFNQTPETQADVVDMKRPHVIMEKADGSMCHGAIINDNVVLMTRMGHTDVAQKAESLLTFDICSVIRELMQKAGATPIFEYTAPDNRIIIKYPTSNLTLLAIRGTKSGTYWGQENVEHYAKKMGVPAISVWESDSQQSAADLVKWGRQVKDMEGFVIRFHDDGQMIKLKGDDYVSKHRAKDGIQQEKNALLTVLNGTVDDVLPLLDSGDADMLRKFNADVHKGIAETAKLVEAVCNEGTKYDQKTFATVVLRDVPTIIHKFCYLVRRGEDALEVITNQLIKSCSTNANVEQQRPIFNAKWNL